MWACLHFTTHTLGFNFTNSTATFEPSVDGLMALTVIIWIYLFTGLAALWYLILDNRGRGKYSYILY